MLRRCRRHQWDRRCHIRHNEHRSFAGRRRCYRRVAAQWGRHTRRLHRFDRQRKRCRIHRSAGRPRQWPRSPDRTGSRQRRRWTGRRPASTLRQQDTRRRNCHSWRSWKSCRHSPVRRAQAPSDTGRSQRCSFAPTSTRPRRRRSWLGRSGRPHRRRCRVLALGHRWRDLRRCRPLRPLGRSHRFSSCSLGSPVARSLLRSMLGEVSWSCSSSGIWRGCNA